MSDGACTSCQLAQELMDVRADLAVARRTNEAYAAELVRLSDEAAAAALEAKHWRKVAGDLVLQAAIASIAQGQQ